MRLTAITNQTSRHPGLVKRCLNRSYLNRLTKLNRKLKVNKWYTSGDIQEGEKLLDNDFPQLEEAIDYEDMGQTSYQGLVMPLSYCPSMDDRNHANRLHTNSPSVLPADHGIPVPPPSPDKSNMLPLPTPPTKGKERGKDESNVGGLLMDLAEDGSEDGTSTPTKKAAGTALPAPTENDAGTIPPAPTADRGRYDSREAYRSSADGHYET